jgi:hypothetical protein
MVDKTKGVPGTTTIYLVAIEGCRSVKKLELIRETSRSWVTGVPWSEKKYAKNKYRVVTEADYMDSLWADKNRYRIYRMIQYGGGGASELRAIANIIGYVEESDVR